MSEPRQALSTQGIIFVNGILSTHDGERKCKITDYCLGLDETTHFFKEFFKDVMGISGAWVIEVINYESQGVSFYHEVWINDKKFFIPSDKISFDV